MRKDLKTRLEENSVEKISLRLRWIGATDIDISRILSDFSDEAIMKALKEVEGRHYITGKIYYLWKLLKRWEGIGVKEKERLEERQAFYDKEAERLRQESEETLGAWLNGDKAETIRQFLGDNLWREELIQLPVPIKKKIAADLIDHSWREISRVRLALRLLLKSTGTTLETL